MKSKGRKRTSQNKAPPKKNVIACAVCGKDDSKYKCPKCRAPYCCVQCSKDHKAKNCSQNSEAAAGSSNDTGAAATPRGTNGSKYLPSDLLLRDPLANMERRRRMAEEEEDDDSDLDEPGWKISTEMMDRINQSAWLKKELSDGGLRQMIHEIDAASGDYDNNADKRRKKHGASIGPREMALARARYSNTKFSNFTDHLLLTAGVLMRVEGNGEIGDSEPPGVGNADDEDEAFGDVSRGSRLILAPVPRRQDRVGYIEKNVGCSGDNKSSESDSDSETSSGGSDDSDSES